MNRLILGINKNGYIFKVTLIPFHFWANYSYYENDFVFDIRFSGQSNIIPSVQYKNLRYTGNITSRVNWKITLDYEPLCVNSHNVINILDKTYPKEPNIQKNCEPSKTEQTAPIIDFVFNEIEVFDLCVNTHKSDYEKIINKDKFREKFLFLMHEWILSEEDLEDFIKNDSIELIKSFLLIESLNLSVVLKQYPELEKHSQNNLDSIIEQVKKKLIAEGELFYLDLIWEDIYMDIYDLLDIPEEDDKTPTFDCNNELIDKLFLNEVNQLQFKDQFYGEIYFRISINEINNENDLLLQGKEIFENCLQHENLYSKIIDTWNNKEVIINLSEEKEKRFIDYEHGVSSLSDIEEKEYKLIYSSILPYYFKYLCTKKQKLKPIINKFPEYINYSKQIIKDLFNYDIVKENKDKIEYVSNDKIENFAQQIFTYK